jgi:uncharacterized membrane protein
MDTRIIPTPLDKLKKLRKPVLNVNLEHKEQLSRLERLALWITEHVGSMGFFLVILLWTVFWLSWNTLAAESARFDPYPAFVLWLFISNMIQILLMPLIMIGQNLQSRHAEHRAENDYEINMRAEREIEAIIQHLERQDELIQEILRRVEK